jgi:hypothetical protein
MDINQFGIKGIGSNVQLGKAGSRIVTNGTALEVKNAANDALVIMRGLDGVGATDFATTAQIIHDVYGINLRKATVNFDDSIVNIGSELPLGSIVLGVLVNVNIAFGIEAELTIGVTGDPEVLLPSSAINLGDVALFGGFVYRLSSYNQLIATLNGGELVGSCDVIVLFANSTISLPGFLTEWTVAGDVTARTITLPLVEARIEGALVYDFYVDWGDGSAPSHVTSFDDANRIHTYSNNGTYRVEITGTMEGWSFNQSDDSPKITNILYWGATDKFDGFKYLAFGFAGCYNLISLGTGFIPASGTGILTDGFNSTFADCNLITSIPEDLFKYHTAITTNAFEYTFMGCVNLQLNSEIFYIDGEQNTRFLDNPISFSYCFYRADFTGIQGIAPDLWNCDYGETITLDVAPSVDWDPGDIISSGTPEYMATAVVVEKLSNLVYRIYKHFGYFAEADLLLVIGTPSKSAQQTGSYPICAGQPTSTGCFAGDGNTLTSLSNYADIPDTWKTGG